MGNVSTTQPIRLAPLGKPRRKIHETEPIEVPEEWPTTVPEPAVPQRQPVPA